MKIPIQVVSWTHEDQSITRAPVDLWVSALLEILTDDMRSLWIQRAQEKIAEAQQERIQPRPLIVLGQG